jgi:hypothetical protein
VDKLIERKRLRNELTVTYRKQANHVQQFINPSVEISRDINQLRIDLKKVDRRSIGKDDDRKKNPRRSPRPKRTNWRCAYPDCEKSMPPGTAAINYKRRHYCSEECAYKDAGAPQDSITAKT